MRGLKGELVAYSMSSGNRGIDGWIASRRLAGGVQGNKAVIGASDSAIVI